MVEFGSGRNYFSPMDREYESSAGSHHDCGHDHGPKSTGDVGVNIGDLGFSFGLGPVQNVQAISAKLRTGTKKVELAFTGMGKGTGQSQTPEYYGKKQRQALRELAQVNRVDFTTHSSLQVTGLAGLGQRGFSKAERTRAVEEVKRAIEFAADVARGGPVVVHTGEIQRPIAVADWNEQGEYKNRFELHEKESGEATHLILDTRTGVGIEEARRNMSVEHPVWNMAKADEKYFEDGKEKVAKKGEEIYVDYFNKKVGFEERIPEYDSQKGTFKTTKLTWNDLVRESKKMTEEAQEAWRKYNSGELSNDDLKDSYWRERIKNAASEGDMVIRPEEAQTIARLSAQAASAMGQATQYGHNYEEDMKRLKIMKIAKESYESMEKKAKTQDEISAFKKNFRENFGKLFKTEEEFTSEFIGRKIRETKNNLRYQQEVSTSQRLQAEEKFEQIRHLRSAESYALEESYDAYALAGIAAMRQSQRLEKTGELKKPISVAMENLWPEQYGSHPDEFKNLVLDSRARMVKRLVDNYNMSEKEAAERAKNHITATLDVGHLNVWRKYWRGDPNKTIKQNDEEFDKWAVKKVGEMTRAGVIGHVHLNDNYGYNDDHLAPGEGNAPIREMVKALKENGYKGEMIVEPGADFTTDHPSGFTAVTKTWQHFGLPVYGRGLTGAGSRTWSDVGSGWFGQNKPAYFAFGGYVPSEDFTLWSGVPLE